MKNLVTNLSKGTACNKKGYGCKWTWKTIIHSFIHSFIYIISMFWLFYRNRPKCSNLPCSHIFYKYNCYPANYQTIKIWMYCPHLQPRYWRPFYRRLPQCCECRRSGFVWVYDTIAAASVAELPRVPWISFRK